MKVIRRMVFVMSLSLVGFAGGLFCMHINWGYAVGLLGVGLLYLLWKDEETS